MLGDRLAEAEAGEVTCGVDVPLVEGFPVGGLDVISSQPPHPQPSICNTLALLHHVDAKPTSGLRC